MFFLVSRSYLYSLACGPFLCLQSQQHLLTFLTSCLVIVLAWISQNNFTPSHHKILDLILLTKALYHKSTLTGSSDEDMNVSRRAVYSFPQPNLSAFLTQPGTPCFRDLPSSHRPSSIWSWVNSHPCCEVFLKV